MSIEKKIAGIEHYADSKSARYGKLLNWQNSHDPFWHYGIGLSDTHIFDTGQGLEPFQKWDAKYVVGIDRIAFEPDLAIARLKHALHVFASWEYNLFGWNCEHLGRLIATNKPRCYQSKPIWWLCDMTPEGDHRSARSIFDGYLKKHAPYLRNLN